MKETCKKLIKETAQDCRSAAIRNLFTSPENQVDLPKKQLVNLCKKGISKGFVKKYEMLEIIHEIISRRVPVDCYTEPAHITMAEAVNDRLTVTSTLILKEVRKVCT